MTSRTSLDKNMNHYLFGGYPNPSARSRSQHVSGSIHMLSVITLQIKKKRIRNPHKSSQYSKWPTYQGCTNRGRQIARLLRFVLLYCLICGPGSSFGIATDYGLDGPGSNPGGDEIFRPSRPALGPIQPSVQWVPGLSRG